MYVTMYLTTNRELSLITKGSNMKNLLLIAALFSSMSLSANIICKKDGRFYYPADAKSIAIAKSLKVKTCNGKRFKAVVAGLGLTTNVPATVKKLTVKEIIAKMKAGK